MRENLGVRWVGANGTSLGGASILKAVSNGCAFDAIIIESVFSDIRTAARNRLEIRFGKFGRFLEPLLTAQIPIWTGIPRDELSPMEWAEKCFAPTLVLSGSLDSRARTWEAKAIFDNLPTASKRINIIAGAGHQDLYEFDSEGYRKEILAFLSSAKTTANETTVHAK